MRLRSIASKTAFALAVSGLVATGALAHHGWNWAEAGQIELTGTISEIYIGPPHPTLSVDAEGEEWTVELGNPRQTEAAGFVEGSAAEGDEVTAIGNRSQDEGENLMKAVRLIVGETVYDIYPDRIQD